jgi:pimeloyl-ACP methyl ester carboxylesterase
MLVWGRKDPVISREMIEMTRRLLVNCQYHEFENTGHAPYFEKSAEFNRLMLGFLNHQESVQSRG